ncbi:helix-turn-helix domain-containing protein [Paenibacillus zanthoxyli]|uniref:helix-turn-helix domain-containing protein n=1 Tax=Paenibacillus zanthoxyli TaxID=369399 RepID=UPI0004708E57|nr:helix-turn-helix transcriptional regulator [Paenibacillus zanthoxyli]
MISNATIRCEMETYIREQGLTMQSFAEQAGVNRGTLSAIINRNPPRKISVRELDLITKGMGLPEGELYSLYAEECFIQAVPHWRRLKPFLLRCAETGKLDCIGKVLEMLLDNLSHIGEIFATAEQMYEQGYRDASKLLYRCVIESEKYNNSERLAISHYRMFQIAIGKDMEANLRAALQFEPYRSWLPVEYRLEALVELLRIYFSVHNWKQFEMLSDELIDLAHTVYRERKDETRFLSSSEGEPIRLRKSLIRYYGQGYLCKATALQKMGRYEEARKAIDCYADLSWLGPINDEDKQEILKYKSWAMANSYTQDILMGRQETLEAYVDFLRSHPAEILPGLVTIVQSANKYHFSIDWIINEFTDSISGFDQFTDVVNMERRLRFAIQYSIYCVRRGKMKQGMESCLKALELSSKTNSETYFGDLIKEFMHVQKPV